MLYISKHSSDHSAMVSIIVDIFFFLRKPLGVYVGPRGILVPSWARFLVLASFNIISQFEVSKCQKLEFFADFPSPSFLGAKFHGLYDVIMIWELLKRNPINLNALHKWNAGLVKLIMKCIFFYRSWGKIMSTSDNLCVSYSGGQLLGAVSTYSKHSCTCPFV